jgi:hypothetical protein
VVKPEEVVVVEDIAVEDVVWVQVLPIVLMVIEFASVFLETTVPYTVETVSPST